MSSPESHTGTNPYDNPDRTAVMAMIHLIGAHDPEFYIRKQVEEMYYNNDVGTLSLAIGLGCSYVSRGDTRFGMHTIERAIATYVPPQVERDFYSPKYSVSSNGRQDPLGLITQARIARVLKSRGQPDLLRAARRRLHAFLMRKMEVQKEAAIVPNMGEREHRLAKGRVHETRGIGLLTRLKRSGLVVAPSLEHEGWQSDFSEGQNPNYDVLIATANPGESTAKLYRTEIKAGCFGHCAQEGNPEITERGRQRFAEMRARYLPSISLISVCCDFQSFGSDSPKGIALPPLLEYELSAGPGRKRARTIAMLNTISQGMLDAAMTGPGAGKPQVIEVSA